MPRSARCTVLCGTEIVWNTSGTPGIMITHLRCERSPSIGSTDGSGPTFDEAQSAVQDRRELLLLSVRTIVKRPMGQIPTLQVHNAVPPSFSSTPGCTFPPMLTSA